MKSNLRIELPTSAEFLKPNFDDQALNEKIKSAEGWTSRDSAVEAISRGTPAINCARYQNAGEGSGAHSRDDTGRYLSMT